MLTAALELADQPAAAQPAFLELPLASHSSRSSAGVAGEPAAQAQRRQQLPPPLSVECRDPLTCVLLAGGNTLLAAGEEPEAARQATACLPARKTGALVRHPGSCLTA